MRPFKVEREACDLFRIRETFVKKHLLMDQFSSPKIVSHPVSQFRDSPPAPRNVSSQAFLKMGSPRRSLLFSNQYSIFPHFGNAKCEKEHGPFSKLPYILAPLLLSFSSFESLIKKFRDISHIRKVTSLSLSPFLSFQLRPHIPKQFDKA